MTQLQRLSFFEGFLRGRGYQFTMRSNQVAPFVWYAEAGISCVQCHQTHHYFCRGESSGKIKENLWLVVD